MTTSICVQDSIVRLSLHLCDLFAKRSTPKQAQALTSLGNAGLVLDLGNAGLVLGLGECGFSVEFSVKR